MLYQKQSLLARVAPKHNQAMLSSALIQELLSSPPADLAGKVAATIGRGLVPAKDVAEACGVTVQAINGWKTNGRVGKQHIKTLARLTGLPVSWWLPGDDLEDETTVPAPWPFASIERERIEALPAERLKHLEGVMLFALQGYAEGTSTIHVPEPRASLTDSARGSVVDMDAAADLFPMRAKEVVTAPLRISTQTGVIANVGPAEAHAANDAFEMVQELADVRLAAGEGIEAHSEEQTGMIQFRRSFLKEVGADGGKARVVYAKGDSMEPVIRDGAALLVVPNENLTIRDLAAGGVYAINYDGKMIVKTVARDKLTQRWVARSFNPTYADIPLENGHPVRVLGQVVWAGARLRDDEAGQWVRY
ncbi:LexA family transcriptional regulator [Achromobacter mucicolens]|uniref:LexA family transcriptional regulator n=1 Tax=Achromobacter mucicolens TaxID=1389922 RepID=UPI00209356BB|nr:S24 family peptidase [Achromobacter mucicolens]